jgi:uncharacterized membrane protein YoaK (UPF0700 family)
MPSLSAERESALVPILLALTVVTGLVDAASVLGLGRVFTANMTGNVVFLGFAAAGSPGLSFARSSAALVAFLLGAVAGGRIGLPLGAGTASRPVSIAFGCETALLLGATGFAVGGGADLIELPPRLYAAIMLTGAAMGIRNAVVRRLAIADLTTTVLTLTLTGLAADSSLAGSNGPRLGRRIASILCMFAGAALGAWLLRRSVALVLGMAGVVSAFCTLATWSRLTRIEAQLPGRSQR